MMFFVLCAATIGILVFDHFDRKHSASEWARILALEESHNATPTQHETATPAENHKETDQ